MAKNVQFEDMANAVEEILKDFSVEVENALEETLDDVSEEIIRDIKLKAPRSNQTDIHLADSFISVKSGIKKDSKRVIYSKEKGYIGHFLEYGTRKTPPQPFLRKIFDDNVRNIAKILSKKVGK